MHMRGRSRYGRARSASCEKIFAAKCAFDDGSRALYATDSSNYRQTPIGVVIPRRSERCDRDGRIARRTRRADHLPRRRDEPGRAMLQRRDHHRHVEIPEPRARHRRRSGSSARVQPGIVLDDLQNARREISTDFWPRSGDAQSLHAGRNDRQQLLRHSFGHGGILRRLARARPTTCTNWKSSLYDGERIARRQNERRGTGADHQPGRPARGDLSNSFGDLRDKYGRSDSRSVSRKFRAAFPATIWTSLLPEKGFNVARALVGTESTCVLILEATLQSDSESQGAQSLLVLGYPDVYHAGDHVPEIRKYKPIGLEGIDHVLINAMKKKHIHPRDLKILPEGKGWLIVEFGGNTNEEADAPARKLMAELKTQSNAPNMKLFDDPLHEKIIWEIRDSGLGASARVPR